jgi:hypothetical protein
MELRKNKNSFGDVAGLLGAKRHPLRVCHRCDSTAKLRSPRSRRCCYGFAASFGEHVGDAMKLVADNVQAVVIPGTGHFVAEEAPEEMLAALTAFLAPYRNVMVGAHS